ncbi:hypothetical protein [Subtercola boreus]|uniref:hypothetical protein n=1 Tax=Subtercola boreus TaxID=120213 RepID=UPI001558C0CE|nr:hypothetical protein [Subtercola boreus]
MRNLKSGVFFIGSLVVLAAIALVIYLAVSQVIPGAPAGPESPPRDIPAQPLSP